MGPEMVRVRVFREEDVRPLWEAAADVKAREGECWPYVVGAVADFPAPDDWRTP
jgi:hypothetical protein